MTQTTHHWGSSWDWDCTLALEYAAEQLLKVSRLPTSEIVRSTEALNIPYLKCISSLLQHEDLLPETVAISLRNARQEHLQMQPPNISKIQRDRLALQLVTILRDVSNLLAAAKLRVAG